MFNSGTDNKTWSSRGGVDWAVETNIVLEGTGLGNLEVELNVAEARMSMECSKGSGILTHLSSFACSFGSWGDLALVTTRTSLE